MPRLILALLFVASVALSSTAHAITMAGCFSALNSSYPLFGKGTYRGSCGPVNPAPSRRCVFSIRWSNGTDRWIGVSTNAKGNTQAAIDTACGRALDYMERYYPIIAPWKASEDVACDVDDPGCLEFMLLDTQEQLRACEELLGEP